MGWIEKRAEKRGKERRREGERKSAGEIEALTEVRERKRE